MIEQMTLFTEIAAVLIITYLLGTIHTAPIISKRLKRVDIRIVGDGNTGVLHFMR